MIFQLNDQHLSFMSSAGRNSSAKNGLKSAFDSSLGPTS